MNRLGLSLKARLMAVVVAVLGLSLAAFSVLLYVALSRALWRQFDARLAAEASAIANLVEERTEQTWEVEAARLADFEREGSGGYFEVWMDDGAELARSRSLGPAELARRAQSPVPLISSLQLPSGRRGRMYQASFLPRPEEGGPPSGRRVVVLLARDCAEVDEALARLRLYLGTFGFASLALAALAAWWGVKTGLQPVSALVDRIDDIDADRLGERLPVDSLPPELRPAVRKLNQLLSRLEQSFARERQFNADVSHELRTPMAGLRTALEVCASRERSIAEYQQAIRESLAIIEQVNRLIENLLMLTKLEARQWSATQSKIALRELVDECFAPLAGRAKARNLRFENRVSPQVILLSDPDKLRIVAANLLDNAVEYTAEGGSIAVESDPAKGTVLDVHDSGPPLPPAALRQVFDRFFRVDASRTGTEEHCGIGLALVRALCLSLGFSAVAENRSDGGVVFRILNT